MEWLWQAFLLPCFGWLLYRWPWQCTVLDACSDHVPEASRSTWRARDTLLLEYLANVKVEIAAGKL